MVCECWGKKVAANAFAVFFMNSILILLLSSIVSQCTARNPCDAAKGIALALFGAVTGSLVPSRFQRGFVA